MSDDRRSVCVVDDDAAARESLAFLLDTAGFHVTSFASGIEFLPAIGNIGCDCLIADIRMPHMSGIELLQRIKSIRSDLPVIIITGHGDVPLAVEAMKLGAADFIEKPYEDERLILAVEHACDVTASVASGQENELETRLRTLTGRERDVMISLARGNPNKVVAYELGISPRTVEIYRAHVMTKMNARSLADIVRFALVLGLTADQK